MIYIIYYKMSDQKFMGKSTNQQGQPGQPGQTGQTGDNSDDKCKVFVGNVPFQCTSDEFKRCFSSRPGYVDSNLIVKFNSDISRGFGYVQFSTVDYANELLRSSVTIENRIVRLSPYTSSRSNSNSDSEKQDGYQLFVDNIPEGSSLEDLNSSFSKFQGWSSCSLRFTDKKSIGTAVFAEYEGYTQALVTPVMIGNNILYVKPFRRSIYNRNTGFNNRSTGYVNRNTGYTSRNTGRQETSNSSNSSNVFNTGSRFTRLSGTTSTENSNSSTTPTHAQDGSYMDGFKAGHIVGLQQGIEQGLKFKDIPENRIS